MKEYRYFHWVASSTGNKTDELNKLLKEGWIPVRESKPSSAVGETGRYLLVLLERDK